MCTNDEHEDNYSSGDTRLEAFDGLLSSIADVLVRAWTTTKVVY